MGLEQLVLHHDQMVDRVMPLSRERPERALLRHGDERRDIGVARLDADRGGDFAGS